MGYLDDLQEQFQADASPDDSPDESIAEATDEFKREPDGEALEAAFRVALDSAVRCLGQREHGRQELERKLMAKGHRPELVGRVLDYLVELDLQSDSRYVEAYMRSRIRKGYGPVKIRQELSSRGIEEDELERQLTTSGDFWLAQAEAVLAKKFGSATSRHDPADSPGLAADHDMDPDIDREPDRDAEHRHWNLQARFLARRGFPSDLIYRVLGSLSG